MTDTKKVEPRVMIRVRLPEGLVRKLDAIGDRMVGAQGTRTTTIARAVELLSQHVERFGCAEDELAEVRALRRLAMRVPRGKAQQERRSG